jgi:hypothetical protein
VFIAAYVLRIFEIRYSQYEITESAIEVEGLFFNSIYLVLMTLATVGCGDISPHTIPGKVIIMFCALWGAFMISLIVLTVGNYFRLNEKQKKALSHIKISKSAAKIISLSFKYFIKKKKFYQLKQSIDPLFTSPFLEGMKLRESIMR